MELSTNKEVLEAYKQNDREALIGRFESFWKNMANDALIKEIHFFKKPAISFVNFAKVEQYNIDASNCFHWVLSHDMRNRMRQAHQFF